MATPASFVLENNAWGGQKGEGSINMGHFMNVAPFGPELVVKGFPWVLFTTRGRSRAPCASNLLVVFAVESGDGPNTHVCRISRP